MTDTKNAFALGLSPEAQLAMPLDDLIHTKRKAPKAPRSAAPRRHQNVKKTVTVPVSKVARARAAQAAASSKRLAVVNRHRKGLAVAAGNKVGRKSATAVRVNLLRSKKTSALRANAHTAAVGRKHVPGKPKPAAHKAMPRTRAQTKPKTGGLDVSNIERHFRTHPTKFDLPKGTNLRITINLGNVKPVVGAKTKQ